MTATWHKGREYATKKQDQNNKYLKLIWLNP